MFKSKINYLLLIIIIIFIGVYLNNSIKSVFDDISNASITDKIINLKEEFSNKDSNDLLDVFYFEGAKIYYWDFVDETNMLGYCRSVGRENGDFYIKSIKHDWGGGINIAVFKNNKIIFKKEIPLQGRAFVSWNGYLNIIEPSKNGDLYFSNCYSDDNYSCCSDEWILTKYKYNSETNKMDKVETKIYAGGKVKPVESDISYSHLCRSVNYPEELEDFEKNESIE